MTKKITSEYALFKPLLIGRMCSLFKCRHDARVWYIRPLTLHIAVRTHTLTQQPMKGLPRVVGAVFTSPFLFVRHVSL